MPAVVQTNYKLGMGVVVSTASSKDEQAQVVAGIDITQAADTPFPVFESIKACDVEADAIIDFSNASAVDGLLDYCVEKQIPVVLCTTGLSEEQLQKVKEASKKVAVLKSANMSLGINLLMKLLQDAAKVLGTAGYDIEIVEKHHNQKVDAPSGTALMIADAMSEVLKDKPHYVYDRHSVRKKRSKNEIGLHAIRGGTIVGEHDVIFAGNDEIIEIKHTAMSKEVFAVGAIRAAKFVAGKSAGMYSMQNMI